MDWEKQQNQQQRQDEVMNSSSKTNNNNNNNGVFVKVMTDEQLEILRKQIAAYATICDQLVQMHKSLSSHSDLTGARLGNLYCDPLMTSVGHKISGRQRWTPTPVQLQILERLFDQGNGTPSKQKIKDITSDLSQHGQISESNVYHWFQNRRARSKRKQHVAAPNNAESEVETEVESPDEKKTKSEDFQSQHNPAPRAEDWCFQNPEISSGMRSLDSKSNKGEPMFPSNGSSKPERSLGQISFYDSMLSNPRIDHLIGKMEASGSYNPYLQEDDYNMTKSIIIMPAFGVQLETHYRSGRIIHRFIPIEKILKPVLNECVTPVTCYWNLSLIVHEEEELVLVFKELHPPVKMLIPIWKALCAATGNPVTQVPSR